MSEQETTQENLVQQAIDEVTNPMPEENCWTTGMSYRHPKPIVETLGHLGQHSEGTLSDLLNTVRRMAETTCEDYDNQLQSCRNRLNESEELSSKLSAHRDALVHSLLFSRGELDSMRRAWSESSEQNQKHVLVHPDDLSCVHRSTSADRSRAHLIEQHDIVIES